MTLSSIVEFLQELWTNFSEAALSALPLSPVSDYLDYFASLPYLGYINWFIPVGTCLEIMAAWIGCIGAYYVLLVILRWAKVIT